MKKLFIVILISAGILSSACGNNNQTVVNFNTATNSAANNVKPDTNTAMPPTEKTVDDGFVASETGTEKAKPDAGKANVQGKVLFNGQPVEGVEVKICEKFSQYIGGCSGESFKTKTDANGEYLLTKITPKDYESLMVQVFKTKDYIFATGNFGIGSAKYRLEADKTFFAPETNLFKDDLKITSPKENAKVSAQNLELKWNAYPDAAYYKFDLSAGGADYKSIYGNKRVDGTNFTVDEPLDNGKYNLKISAYNSNDAKLADSGNYLEFTVQGGADAAAANK